MGFGRARIEKEGSPLTASGEPSKRGRATGSLSGLVDANQRADEAVAGVVERGGVGNHVIGVR